MRPSRSVVSGASLIGFECQHAWSRPCPRACLPSGGLVWSGNQTISRTRRTAMVAGGCGQRAGAPLLFWMLLSSSSSCAC